MAHWAEIDENNKVIRVLVGSNNEPDEGYQWLIDNVGGRWIKTSYNTHGNQHRLGGVPLRKNYACKGFTYDEIRDAFIPPMPPTETPLTDLKENEEFFLNEKTCLWEIRPVASE
jgi:hypothetical protein